MTSPESIAYAFRKIDDFAAVQASKPSDDQQEAFNLLLVSVGLDEKLKDDIYNHIIQYAPGAAYSPRTLGFMLLGVVCGLAIAEYERDFSA